jgi:hypothetical protein
MMKEFAGGFRKGMKMSGETIGTLVNSLLLLVVYVVAVGLTSLVAKIAGRKFLEFGPKSSSYWSPLNLKKKKMDEYYRQF